MSSEEEKNVLNRSWLVARIRAEVVGPDPSGEPLVPSGLDKLPDCTWPEFHAPRMQQNGEEVLWQDTPLKRYGAGILYPAGSHLSETGTSDGVAQEEPDSAVSPHNDKAAEGVDESVFSRDIPSADDSEDYDVSLANAMSPSAIGLSFLADLSVETDGIVLELVNVNRTSQEELCETPSATYRQSRVTVKDDKGREIERSVWLREPLVDSNGEVPKVEISVDKIKNQKARVIRKPVAGVSGLESVIVSRPWKQASNGRTALWLLTVTFVNKKNRSEGSDDASSIFQTGIRVSGKLNACWIVPYPESGQERHGPLMDSLSDETINRILYREHRTYAIGHGCSADWSPAADKFVSSVWSDVLPAYETPATTAELEVSNEDGNPKKLKVSMRKLAGLDPATSGKDELNLLVHEYESWIQRLRRDELPLVDEAETGEELIARCELCLGRIRDGISLLESGGEMGNQARQAFALANHAMLIAQLRGGAQVRSPDYSVGTVTWSRPGESHDPSQPHPFKGYWRPFQIAFLLMSMRGICEPEHADREMVDLIWFPTGGGKTEAYLGVTAFTIFFNQLAGRETAGCDVLMRYTLRLLTAQQFQRAATLFCAMDQLRSGNEKDLGAKPFTLGLWVGGGTTPNRRKDALAALKELERNPSSENPFVVLQCPWCAAQMGPLEHTGAGGGHSGNRGARRGRSVAPSVIGYVRAGMSTGKTVVYQCPDSSCEFGAGSALSRGKRPIPIATIDEDLILNPPRLLIGTVDKFAMLAWKPELRSFFGIAADGRHHSAPPSLIIQDELHLISGPLGTMVGAYEMVIDRLCREHGVGDIGPKIIASTATISRSREQIKHLYARNTSMLFPPSGLKSSDSFFAREAEGPGRMYLGVMAPAHYSLQTTETRVFAALLQSVAQMPTDENGKDPWWTLLCFFNSLRELGSAGTLMVADVREYMQVLLKRHGWDKLRWLSEASELTSRIRGDEIPKELAKLEIPVGSSGEDGRKKYPVDVCLASNIIEVGIDLPRLSLMSVVGQPKSTSQYIQVSSRVGRGKDKPGLVVVLYGQSKPRDRSHYEHFRGYHQKLYAQVEPTSVTPFSTPAIERAIQGIMIATTRQLGELKREGQSPRPYPLAAGKALTSLLEEMLCDRSDAVTDGEETVAVLELLRKRLNEWQAWDPSEYGKFGSFPESPPLMYPAGANSPAEWNGNSWPVLSSLRNVDASGEAEITDWFNTPPSSEEQQ